MKKLKPEILIVSLYFLLATAWVSITNSLPINWQSDERYYHLALDVIFIVLSVVLLYMFINGLYKTKAKLRDSESEIRGIFDGAQELFCLIDRKFTVLDFNKRFEDAYLSFYEKKIFKGLNYLDIFPEQEREIIFQRINIAFEGNAYDFERSISNNGVELWLRINYKPIFDKSGVVSSMIISMTDITTYKLSLVLLDESHSKLESIFNYSTDALFIIDENREFIIDCNSTTVHLFEAESKNQIIGLTGADLHFNSIERQGIDYIKRNFSENSNIAFEFEYKTFKGNKFWGNLSGKTIETPNGNINLVRVVDVTPKKNAEQKIFQIERKFRQLADSSPAMLWISDHNGKIIFYNQSWLNFRGLTLIDEMDWGWKDGIFPEDYHKLIYEVYNPAIEKKEGYTTEYRLKRKDGIYRWLLENTIPKFDFDGNFEGLFGSAIDITELKEIQQKIAESEAKFRELANSSPMMLWTADVYGDITFYNSAWLNFTGRKLEQEIGKGWIDNVHPDDIIPYVHNTYYESFRTQKSYSVEFRLKRYDGEFRWVFESGTPKFDSEGEFEGLVGSAVDITDRKAAELNLKHQEKFNSRISELSPDFIYIYDLTLKQNIYSNRSLVELVGYTLADYPYFNENVFLELIHPDDYPIVKYTDEYFVRFKELKFIDQEFRMKAPNGGWKWIHSRETIFSNDEKGNASQILGNARDITEKKLTEQEIVKTNEELKTINEELDSFVYRASHDLRAPLSSVLGLINLAKTDVKDETSVFYFDMMEKSVQKLSNVTNDLIDHARNASMAINIDLIDFKTIINDIIDGMRFHENAARIQFDIKIDSQNEFYSDKLRIVLLFNNLISNAIKYHDISKNEMYLKIKIKLSVQKAEIEVADNGMGIEEQYQDKIFDMFFRANKSVSGTGLGLYIVKGAIDKLKGTMRLESKPKKGTTFFVELPNRIL